MAYFDIERLEKQVNEIIECCRRLQEDNETLRARQESLTVERAELIQKTDLARSRIEATLARLKTMEESL
ncbi:TIGR02449 family protein [Thioflavicoccus mobilis 8321]|uniref:TIGR02449 family protein n=1 Tax=Thioflavicoccus mobilis 8321 TaxID=765912 RepID=L0GVK6_9GAMM|nr:TIGR02449 family protein [Thioflavicoccus mobilis]AGA89991.1 TIGR02449 family protein [Thioflavicoccus mobilis 8321]